MPREIYSEILNKYLEIPDEPRVVSLAPSITDSIAVLDRWDLLVGISIYCKVPDGLPEKPRVGSYLKVLYRRLNELNPDLILLTTGAQRGVMDELSSKGYKIYPIPLPTSIYGILENLYIIGSILDAVENALNRISSYISLLNEIRSERLGTVYYEVDLGEPITVGASSYINSSLYHIGLLNIFSRYMKAYFKPDFKVIKHRDPDFIIYEMSKAREVSLDGLIKIFYERGWNDLKAVREGRVIILPQDSLAHYGPAHFDTLRELRDLVLSYIK